jgi:hypothetical protein
VLGPVGEIEADEDPDELGGATRNS